MREPAGPTSPTLSVSPAVRRAEHRYLRGRPGPAGTTGGQRVRPVRECRAAEPTAAAWVRRNADGPRRLAGQITPLTDLPTAAHTPLGELNTTLALDDPAALLHPLNATRPHLAATDLADRAEALTNSVMTTNASPADRYTAPCTTSNLTRPTALREQPLPVAVDPWGRCRRDRRTGMVLPGPGPEMMVTLLAR
jgi:hypothetical protein